MKNMTAPLGLKNYCSTKTTNIFAPLGLQNNVAIDWISRKGQLKTTH
jgi:hypothetical protein